MIFITLNKASKRLSIKDFTAFINLMTLINRNKSHIFISLNKRRRENFLLNKMSLSFKNVNLCNMRMLYILNNVNNVKFISLLNKSIKKIA